VRVMLAYLQKGLKTFWISFTLTAVLGGLAQLTAVLGGLGGSFQTLAGGCLWKT